jgi:hypothetical protein
MSWDQEPLCYWSKTLIHELKPHLANWKLHNHEITLNTLMTILAPILQSGMGCLYVYGEGTLIHLCLVSNELNFPNFGIWVIFNFSCCLLLFLNYDSREKVQSFQPCSWKHGTYSQKNYVCILCMLSPFPLMFLCRWWSCKKNPTIESKSKYNHFMSGKRCPSRAQGDPLNLCSSNEFKEFFLCGPQCPH